MESANENIPYCIKCKEYCNFVHSAGSKDKNSLMSYSAYTTTAGNEKTLARVVYAAVWWWEVETASN